MRTTADGQVAVRADSATGKVGLVRATTPRGDLLPSVAADSRAEALAKADQYVDTYALAFGATAAQLDRSEVFTDRYGWSITYDQTYQGLPVFAGELKAHVDRQGRLSAVTGFVAPHINLSTSPRISESEATERAIRMVRARPSGHESALPEPAAHGLEARSTELSVYRMGSTRGIAGANKLAWVVEVWNRSTVRETVILDAQTGKYLNRWSMMAHALDRELYEEAYDPEHLVWSEGDAFPGALDEDQQSELLGTAEAYWMFMNTFGYDAWDGAGGQMITVNNDPTIECPNANWNGVTTNYCTGVTGDDTVAHEWGHAYTESTSGLIYQWQSGAMNEAYSDIWGEVVDMLNTRHNEGGETQDDPTLREPGKCSIYQPASYELGVTIDAPADIAGPCEAAPAAFGPELTGSRTVDVVVAQDAEDPDAGDTAVNGCSTPYDNAAAVAGNWVYVERGFCTFQQKVDNAEANGALGIVVGNNQDGLVSMSGTADIPGFMITTERGDDVESAEGPVTMTIERLEDPNAVDDTYRWLSGESDPAFGGAIRDMWNPNCFGDPGQVSDAEYHCDVDDNGGVHTNSGVVNRTFAIMVDGYEPSGVAAIGLDKAANLFWHTQTNYLTPISDFENLADGLEASCTDLQGDPINAVTLGNPTEPDGSDGAATPAAADPITAADCAAVADAIAETELRVPPVQCNFQPMLEQGDVDCGARFESVTTWSEDFEDGLEGWEQDFEFGNYAGVGFPDLGGAVHHPWVTTDDLPLTTDLPGDAGEHPASNVAYAADPTTGSCAGDEEDESSRDGLISPEIEVPDGYQPRLSFDHLMASETTWDGGNVKVSINGGDYVEIPAAAWLLNGPQGHLAAAAEGNSNPLAGQTAFTGTDGGEPTGSWGTSVISLGRMGAHPGDLVQFRFDFGRDGCNGVDGWYVDDLEVTVCEQATPSATTTKVTSVKPNPVKRGDAFKVRIKVTGDDDPTGKVQVVKGRTVLGSARLKPNGTAQVIVKKVLAVGRHRLVATYLGNASSEPSRDRFTVRVVRKR
ncbi:M4 family metallopeptidase [Nocardioides pyridinolyticus]